MECFHGAAKQSKIIQGRFGYQLLKRVGDKYPRLAKVHPDHGLLCRASIIYGLICEFYNWVGSSLPSKQLCNPLQILPSMASISESSILLHQIP